MAQSINELERREKALDEREAGLNAYAREIQERERNVKVAEDRITSRADIERDDYLFDSINRHQMACKPVVVEVPAPRGTDSPLDCLTAFMATLAAVFTLTILVLILI